MEANDTMTEIEIEIAATRNKIMDLSQGTGSANNWMAIKRHEERICELLETLGQGGRAR